MIKLAIIQHNPAMAGVITAFGIILLAAVAALIVALWVVVARGRARRDQREFDDSADDHDLEVLRHRRLVRRSPASGEPQAEIVTELEPMGESEPTAR